jgi:hypothetical protein
MMPKFEAYRSCLSPNGFNTGDRIWCGGCGKPFPLKIVLFEHRFDLPAWMWRAFDRDGDIIIWEGKWRRYDATDGLLSPHDDLLKNLSRRRAGAGTRHLAPMGKALNWLYEVRVLKFPGCPRAATCPHCKAQNSFNAVKLRVSPEEPSTTLTR